MSKLSFISHAPDDIYAEVCRTRLAAEEIRLGLRRPGDAAFISTFAAAQPGVVHYQAPNTRGIVAVSERGLLALMGRLPTGGGADLVHAVIASAGQRDHAPALRPYSRNNPAMLQPGDDVLFEGKRRRVEAITVAWSAHAPTAVSWLRARRSNVVVQLAGGGTVPGTAIQPLNAMVLDEQAARLCLLRPVAAEARRALRAACVQRNPPHNWVERYRLASAAHSAVAALVAEAGTQRAGYAPKGIEGRESMERRALRVRDRSLRQALAGFGNVMAFDDWQGCGKLVETLQGERAQISDRLQEMKQERRARRSDTAELVNGPNY